MITGGDTVVGAAAIEIYPVTEGFQTRLKEQTNPAFGKLGADAERAGRESGQKLEGGFKKGTSGIASALAGLGLPLGNLGGHLSKTADGLGHVDQKGKGLVGTLSTLGGGTLAVATAGVVGFGVAGVKAAASYESATATIAAQAHIGEAAAKTLSNAFLSTMGHAIYSAQAIATAYGGVAGVLGSLNGKALDAAQAQKVMAASMDLAEGAGISLESSTQDLAKTMQAYHLQVGESAHASDVLFTAARETGIPIDALTAGLTRTKSKLGDLAPSLGESAGLLVSLAKAGVTGRTAISTLSTSFQTLVGGSKETTKVAGELGLHIFDASGKFVGMRSVLEQLTPKLAQYNSHAQEQITKALFGKTANQQFLDVIKQGPAAFAANTAAVSRSGAAHEAAEKQAKTLSHRVELLKATAVDLAIKFGNFLIPKLRELAGTISEGITWLSKHKEAAKQLAIVVTTILGVAVGVYLVNKMKSFTDSFVKAGRTLGIFAAENTATATTVETEGAAMVGSADTTAAGVDTALGSTGVGLIIVGLGLAATELATHWEESMQALEKATEVAGNVIIEILNRVIRGYNETAGELLGTIGELEKIHPEGEESGFREDEPKSERQHFTKKEEEENAREGTPLEGGTKTKTQGGIMAYFMSKLHLTAAQAAGIIGNIEQESGTDPTAPGGGLFQDEKGRGPGARASVHRQIEKAAEELISNPSYGLAALRKAKTPQEAARIFAEDFERPKKGPTENLPHREEAAAQALKAHRQHAKAVEHDTTAMERHTKAVTGHGTLPTSSASKKAGIGSKAKAEGYVDPFEHASGLVRGREDEGIDFTARAGSKIGAIGAGIIDKIIPNWFKGQPLIEEKLTSGAEKGKFVYYAEQISKAVREGQHVKAGQLIGTVAAHGTGLELGFGAGGGRTLAQATTGYKEGQKTPAAEEFSKFLTSVGKGGSQLQTASKVFETIAKAELKKQTADKKSGESELSKMSQAIQSGNLKDLARFVGKAHETGLTKLEHTLSHDHLAALTKLSERLVTTHKRVLEEWAKASLKAQEEAIKKKDDYENTINTQIAENTAARITDLTKVQLDYAAEGGKTGAALMAAQSQRHFDEVKLMDDELIGVAKLAADQAAGHGEAAEAAAQQALVNAENQAKINEANAQAQLDLANNAATEAQTKATEAQTRATEEQTKATEKATGQAAGVSIGNLTLNGKDISTGELVSELGWSLRTGALPVATAPAVVGG